MYFSVLFGEDEDISTSRTILLFHELCYSQLRRSVGTSCSFRHGLHLFPSALHLVASAETYFYSYDLSQDNGGLSAKVEAQKCHRPR